MKNLHTLPASPSSSSLLTGWLFFLGVLWASYGHAQERPMAVVYDEKEQPSHIEREVIVRFDPAEINVRAVDDIEFQGGLLKEVLRDGAIEQLSKVLGYDAGGVEVFKIFTRMTSADTLSVTRLGDTIRVDDHWATFVLQLPKGFNEQETSKRLNEASPLVRYAHLNWVLQSSRPITPMGTPQDALFTQQANLQPTSLYKNGHINILGAWANATTGSNAVRVGVVDSGIDNQHPDFALTPFTSVVTGGRNYVPGAPAWDPRLPQDFNGHGTAAAGIIGAIRNNQTGIAGIAGGTYGVSPSRPGVQLFDLRALAFNGQTVVSTLAATIVDGASNFVSSGGGAGLDILNISAGSTAAASPGGPSTLKDAMRTAYQNNCIVVAARGNGASATTTVTSPYFPATFFDDWVISVGASGTDGQYKYSGNGNNATNAGAFVDPSDRAYESSYGSGMDLIAPGTTALVVTTGSRNAPTPPLFGTAIPGYPNYTTFNGTSAAAPHVAGVAALVLSNFNTPSNKLAPEDVEQLLQFTAKDRNNAMQQAPNIPLATPGYDDLTGWGLLDAGAAMERSKPGVYKFVHARILTRTNQGPLLSNQQITLASNYTSRNSGITYSGGIPITADIYRVSTTVQVRSSNGTGNPVVPVPDAADALLRVWPRNGASNMWGPVGNTGLVTPEPGIRVTSPNAPPLNAPYYTQLANQNTIVVEGYAYLVRVPNSTSGQVEWIPNDPTTNARFDLTFYTYNQAKDYPYYYNRAATGFSSTAYPNPAARNMAITYDDSPNNGTAVVEIWSMTGRKMQQFSFAAATDFGLRTVQLELPELPTGLYTYRLITAQGVSVGKFIKE